MQVFPPAAGGAPHQAWQPVSARFLVVPVPLSASIGSAPSPAGANPNTVGGSAAEA